VILSLHGAVRKSGAMRYWPAIVLLCVSVVAFAGAVWLMVLAELSTGGYALAAVRVGLVAFLGAALAVGRIRRIRTLTPEAIIRGHDDRRS
jgi:predicted membrane-bound spermidine synthase